MVRQILPVRFSHVSGSRYVVVQRSSGVLELICFRHLPPTLLNIWRQKSKHFFSWRRIDLLLIFLQSSTLAFVWFIGTVFQFFPPRTTKQPEATPTCGCPQGVRMPQNPAAICNPRVSCRIVPILLKSFNWKTCNHANIWGPNKIWKYSTTEGKSLYKWPEQGKGQQKLFRNKKRHLKIKVQNNSSDDKQSLPAGRAFAFRAWKQQVAWFQGRDECSRWQSEWQSLDTHLVKLFQFGAL